MGFLKKLLQSIKEPAVIDLGTKEDKNKCYIVGFTYGGSHIDSTLVMVEPSGELVTELQETESWLEASGEIGKISNFVFSK